jgi:bacterioferritin-associated ferredoxin
MQFHLQRGPRPSHTAGVIVCLCRGVSDRQVRLAVLTGASTLRQVVQACDAGRGCGACHEMIRDMIDQGASAAGGNRPANDNRPVVSACCATPAPARGVADGTG